MHHSATVSFLVDTLKVKQMQLRGWLNELLLLSRAAQEAASFDWAIIPIYSSILSLNTNMKGYKNIRKNVNGKTLRQTQLQPIEEVNFSYSTRADSGESHKNPPRRLN